jgi:hypothetical protein
MSIQTRYMNLPKNELNPISKLEMSSTDLYIQFNKSKMIVDNLAFIYYGNSEYDYLIKLANPEYVYDEDFEDSVIIRIPFPLDSALFRYEAALSDYFKL